MREPDQRFWDALVIRSWNRFDSCSRLKSICIAEFGCYPDELPLLRVKECYGGVRAWVATALPELSEKLWILPKERQIELLDWLAHKKLDCISYNKKAAKYHKEAYNASRKDELKAEQSRISYNMGKLLGSMAQPNTVKATDSRARRRAR